MIQHYSSILLVRFLYSTFTISFYIFTSITRRVGLQTMTKTNVADASGIV